MKKLFVSALLFVFTTAIITYAPLYSQENTATQTINYIPIIPKIENEKAIDTLFPDPLSESFRQKSKFDDKEKGKSVLELINEFEQQAAKIASSTVVPEYTEDRPPELDEFGNIIKPAPQDKTEVDAKLDAAAEGNATPGDAPAEIADDITDSDIPHADEASLTDTVPSDVTTGEAPDDSFYETDENLVELSGDQIPVDDGSKPLPDMVAQGDEAYVDDDEAIDEPTDKDVSTDGDAKIADAEPDDESDISDKVGKKEKKSKKKKDKPESLEPFLITDGNPALDQAEITRLVKLRGYIYPETHPITRRKHLFRWVIKVDDEKRIPLRSSLKILQEVNDESLFETELELMGRYQTSPLNENLKYFIVDSISKAPQTATASDTTKIASATADIASGTPDIATETLNIATAGDIASDTGDIVSGTPDIASDTGDIISGTPDIATDTLNIATAGNIASDTGDIVSGTPDIATDTLNIASDTLAIPPAPPSNSPQHTD